MPMRTPGIDFDVYSTILFMDSMVALEAKPLGMLSWHEIDDTGPILVLVVPQVNKEIDKRKRDGRLGQRARAFNRLIAPAAESASTARISESQVVVDIALAVCERIDWDVLDDLDPADGDARVVAEILCSRDVPPDTKLLFSHDINPIAMAARHGLRCRKMPDHWLLEPEPSPYEKEMTRLKARVKELEATAPDLVCRVTFDLSGPLQLYQVRPLSDEGQSELVDRILAENPKPIQNNNVLGLSSLSYDASLDSRYKKYCTAIVPTYASTLHRHLERHYGQVPFLLCIQNIGHVQAENLVVALTAVGGTLHDRFIAYPIFGPSAPEPKPPAPSFYNFEAPFLRRQVGRHEMEFAVGPNQGNTIEVHAQTSGRKRSGDFAELRRLIPTPAAPSR